MPAVQIDAYLDPLTGDLPEVSKFVTGIELVEQRIRLHLRRGIGEWFLDRGVGLPLIEWRQQKPPRVNQIMAIIQKDIRAIPGVVATANFVADHDQAARRLTITGDVIVATRQVTSVVATASTDVERNVWSFQAFFARGSGPIFRPGRI